MKAASCRFGSELMGAAGASRFCGSAPEELAASFPPCPVLPCETLAEGSLPSLADSEAALVGAGFGERLRLRRLRDLLGAASRPASDVLPGAFLDRLRQDRRGEAARGPWSRSGFFSPRPRSRLRRFVDLPLCRRLGPGLSGPRRCRDRCRRLRDRRRLLRWSPPLRDLERAPRARWRFRSLSRLRSLSRSRSRFRFVSASPAAGSRVKPCRGLRST